MKLSELTVRITCGNPPELSEQDLLDIADEAEAWLAGTLGIDDSSIVAVVSTE